MRASPRGDHLGAKPIDGLMLQVPLDHSTLGADHRDRAVGDEKLNAAVIDDTQSGIS
ncbi:hypothetical protein U716_02715 [Rhodobacter capsulatus B6]|nr:hypothetical protein U716_02715 [Rhodobacter capsulatus B6]